MPTDDELGQRADALAGVARSLTTQVNVLGDTIRRQKRFIIGVVIGLALDLILTVLGAYLFMQQQSYADRLLEVQNRIRAEVAQVQDRTSNEVLCPLYKVFLDSYDKARRDALPPDRQAKYDEAFVVIRRGAEVLRCQAQ